MIHYTCDRCKAEIDPTNESRYVVEVDVQRITAEDDEPIEADEVDSLSQLHHVLEGHSCGTTVDNDAIDDGEPSTHHAQYDLCPRCYKAFRRNPLGREASFALHFSKN